MLLLCGDRITLADPYLICHKIERISLENKTTNSGLLKISFYDNSLLVSLNDLVKEMELIEGEFFLPKSLKTKSGCPVLSYLCYCETEEDNRDFYLSIKQSGEDIVIIFQDSITSRSWEKHFPLEVTVKSKKRITNNIFLPEFNIKKNTTLTIMYSNEKYCVDINSILKGGIWSIENNLKYGNYQGVIKWSCKPNISDDISCYCDSILSRDDPTCRNYIRTIHFAYEIDNKKNGLLLEPFRANFDIPNAIIILNKIYKIKLDKIK